MAVIKKKEEKNDIGISMNELPLDEQILLAYLLYKGDLF